MAWGTALFTQPGCDSLGLVVWLVPGWDRMGSVRACVANLRGVEEQGPRAVPPLARHWATGSGELRVCSGVVWSLQTPCLELPRGTKQETCWAEGCGIGLSPVLTRSTFPSHALLPFSGSLSAMKQGFCLLLSAVYCWESLLSQAPSAVAMNSLSEFNLLQ